MRERPDVFVLSDEIHSRLLYSEDFASIASQPGMGPDERTIILDGFSKTYAMTGWRLGYGVMPERLAEQVARLQVNSNSCTNAATQYAGLEALTGPQDSVGEMLEEFRVRRDLIVSSLNDLSGVECVTPQGAFYAFPSFSFAEQDADTLADRLLQEAGVACLSGTGFGGYGGGHLRFSYANSRENISRALGKMAEFFSESRL